MKRHTLLFIGMLSCMAFSSAYATTISGVGFGANESEAKDQALADLASNISAQVKKQVLSTLSDKGRSGQVSISVYSNLPIRSPQLFFDKKDGQYKAMAAISTEGAFSAYMAELQRLQKNIDAIAQVTDYDLLQKLLKDVIAFQQNKIVANILNEQHQRLPKISVSENAVMKKIRDAESNIVSLNQAGEALTKNIDQERVYLIPPVPNQSDDITQLSRQLKMQMAKHLKLVDRPENASYILRGGYDVGHKNVFVTMQLYDKFNRVLITNTATLQPKAYQGLKYKPDNSSFDYEVSHVPKYAGSLSVKIGFRGFNTQDAIDLQNGKSVDLVVKANRSICYYLVGHILHEDAKLSYLIPLVDGDTPYVNRITGSDVNKSIIALQGLEVSAPFGRESLQIFASTLGKNGQCPLVPPSCEDNADGYCVISGKPAIVLSNTRGLMTKKQTGNYKTEKAEAALSFTTH